jgi:putative membrane protein
VPELHLRTSSEAAARRRRWELVAGIFVLWLVAGSPLSLLDHQLLIFHMVQHLLLMTVAAPLILLGTGGLAFLGAFQGSAAVQWVGRWLAHAVSCWIAGTAVVIAWHVPAAHALGMSSPAWHAIQQASFFAGGILFWWPIIGDSSQPLARSLVPLYLFLATLPCDALSAFLAFCGRVVYPSHHAATGLFGLSPLQDQECAGALMWFWVTIAYLLPAIAVTLSILTKPASSVSAPRDAREAPASLPPRRALPGR